ncbi:hypothetical protein ACF3OC_08040 [Sphingobacterium cellulitidis]|uniref:hypothetical protein n=1 Tax=Sphingobacterium cellulitidis TaxID=1768011 RepID=UPI00370D087D
MSNFVLDQNTPLEPADNIHGLVAVKHDGLGGAIGLSEVATETAKQVGGALKLNGNVLPALGTGNVYLEVLGGPTGKTLTYPGAPPISVPAYSIVKLFGEGATNTWTKVDESPLPKGADGKSATDWAAQAYSNGAQVFYDKRLFELAPGQSAVAADVPGTSVKWIEKVGGGDDEKWIVDVLPYDAINDLKWTDDWFINSYGTGISENAGMRYATVKVGAGTTADIYWFGYDGAFFAGVYATTEIKNPLQTFGVMGPGGSQGKTVQITNDGYLALNFPKDRSLSGYSILLRPTNPNTSLKKEVDAAYLDARIKRQADRWKTSYVKTDISNELNWRSGYIDKNGNFNNDGGFNYTQPKLFKAGSTISGLLLSDSSKALINAFSSEDISSYIGPLMEFPFSEGSYVPFEITIDTDTYVSFQGHSGSRYWPKEPRKVFITGPEVRESDAQKLVDATSVKSIKNKKDITLTMSNTGMIDGFQDNQLKPVSWPGLSLQSQNIDIAGFNSVELTAVLNIVGGSLAGYKRGSNGNPDEGVWIFNSSFAGVNDGVQLNNRQVDLPMDRGIDYIRLTLRGEPLARYTPKLTLINKQIGEISVQDVYEMAKAGDTALTELREVFIDRPDFMEIHLDIEIPTDASDNRTKTSGTARFMVNGKPVLQSKCKMSIQGHFTANYLKKGFTFDLLNSEDKKLKVKIGDLISTDSFHLKSYATDRTQSKDVCTGRVWRAMLATFEYPLNKVNNKVIALNPSPRKNEAWISDAKYHTDGIVVGLFNRGSFYGLYTLRLKKTRENYALDNENKDHIYLDSLTYSSRISEPFNHTEWEAKSPKMEGYGGEISRGVGDVIPDPVVLANITRLFDFTSQINTRWTEHADYIILPYWVVYAIIIEVFGHWDIDGNNVNLITWDSKHWAIIPYDMDHVLGSTGSQSILTFSNWVSNADGWGTFKTRYAPEIKAMYTKYRRNGFLTVENLMPYYVNHTKHVPREMYEADIAKWASIYSNNEPTIEQMMVYLKSRFTFLDTHWLLPA